MGTSHSAMRERARVGGRQRRVLVVALVALLGTVLALAEIPPPGTPTEMWPSLAASFIWTTVVWDGRSRPGRDVLPHLAAQLVIFVGPALAFGWGPADSLWMATANIAGGILMAVVYARFGPSPEWSPGSAVAHVGLLVSAVVASAAVALVGGFPHVAIGALDELQLWWTIRSMVYAYVGGATFLLLFFGVRRATTAPRWAVALLVPLGAAGLWVTYLNPNLPLTWSLLLPAIAAGSMLSPRGAATYALGVAVGGALATLHPINQFGYDGFIPGSVLIDLLLTASTFVTLQLAILRDQRAEATAELDRQSRAAHEQATLLGTVFDTMSDGLVVVDEHRRVVMHNTAARQLLGRRIPVGQEMNWSTYLGLHDLDREPLTDAALPGSGVEHAARQIVVRGDGGERVLGVGSWDLPGQDARTLVLFSDVTAERERLGELTSFAGVVAHDLRSPLAGLSGWLEMAADALEEAGPSPASTFVSRAQLSGERMRQVIEDWLAYTVQRDGLLAVADVPLKPLVAEVVAPYASSGPDLAPVFEVAADDVVHADPVLTRQLIANLVSNAVKYTPQGVRPEVAVRSGPDEEPGFVRVTVSDHGIGLPEGEEELIFQEFHRAPGHAADYTGTGLGLSLCRKIVHRHGGTISARNNPDGGTAVSFTLPAA
ncbi:sensor histidine kinase [Nocardioides euryhalodurans]|uniref:Sensor-like histidine kinase SenX3 n=1 Tax=Nocardioides euryhalodurans TaxID=2518370 RepID=A0A4P7GNZ6_9ACTN|nr:ATP-binding protein [Nocardioides euryhalodurans]QBR93945.1 PAS domain-containing protein [Nocardioides euryhalodurans]